MFSGLDFFFNTSFYLCIQILYTDAVLRNMYEQFKNIFFSKLIAKFSEHNKKNNNVGNDNNNNKKKNFNKQIASASLFSNPSVLKLWYATGTCSSVY